jgi:translation initiation factor 2B subunit (eIF-2B alpha/beta/delta family)
MAVERAARAGIERACTADEGAARAAAGQLDGARVLTLSRSSTVRRALRRAAPERVLVAESRPDREGVGVAEALVGDSMDVTLLVDAAVAHVLAERDIDAVLVGADTVLPDGSLVNKVGTRAAALAAAREGVPLYVVAAIDKIGTRDEPDFEAGDPRAVYDGDAPLDAANPTFDATPPDLLAGFLTEEGPLDPGAAGAVAAELRALADWPGSGCSEG